MQVCHCTLPSSACKHCPNNNNYDNYGNVFDSTKEIKTAIEIVDQEIVKRAFKIVGDEVAIKIQEFHDNRIK